MSSRKQPRITNIWSKITEGEGGALFTRVVIESTGTFEYKVNSRGNDIFLELSGTVANMPEETIEVNDGLVREVSLTRTGADTATVKIYLDHPAGYNIAATRGLPARIILMLDRSFLNKLFEGKVFVIDPGHGGRDPGGKGPVNLLEKNVVIPIAQNLKKFFEQVGARAVLTRKGDENISLRSRVNVAKKEKANLYISIHTHSGRNSKVSGAAVLFGINQESSVIANIVNDDLIKKLRVVDRGLGESRDYNVLSDIPVIEVEVVTITNWVEEGLLRSPTFHKKAAEGIFNGVKNYFAKTGRH